MRIAIAVLLWGVSSLGAVNQGVTFEEQIEHAGKSLLLNGTGVREVSLLITSIDVYVAGLYATKKSSDPIAVMSDPGLRVVKMRFLRDVSKKDILKAWKKGLDNNCKNNCEAIHAAASTMNEKLPDLKEGDWMVYSFEKNFVELKLNGKELGTIRADYADHEILACWLGENPPNESLKQGLLGRSGD